jgi:hypothetical protein
MANNKMKSAKIKISQTAKFQFCAISPLRNEVRKNIAKNSVKKFVGHSAHKIINQSITGHFLSHALVPKIKRVTTSNAHHRLSSQSFQFHCPIKSTAKIIVKKFVGQANHQIINQPITGRFLSHAPVPKIRKFITSNAHQSQSSQSFHPTCPIKFTAKIIVKKFVGHFKPSNYKSANYKPYFVPRTCPRNPKNHNFQCESKPILTIISPYLSHQIHSENYSEKICGTLHQPDYQSAYCRQKTVPRQMQPTKNCYVAFIFKINGVTLSVSK